MTKFQWQLINMFIGILANEPRATVSFLVYTDDFFAAGMLQDVRRWWNTLAEIGQ